MIYEWRAAWLPMPAYLLNLRFARLSSPSAADCMSWDGLMSNTVLQPAPQLSISAAQCEAKGWPALPSHGRRTLLLGCPQGNGTGLGDVHMHFAVTDMPPWVQERSSKPRI